MCLSPPENVKLGSFTLLIVVSQRESNVQKSVITCKVVVMIIQTYGYFLLSPKFAVPSEGNVLKNKKHIMIIFIVF